VAVIEFENVRKAYRRGYGRGSLRDAIPQLLGRVAGRDGRDGGELLWALDGVSFEVNEGETLGLIGPNGAGKTTALKLISRVAKPTSGRIAVRGRLSALIELGAGFHPDLTGRENIYLNAAILGLKKREIDEKFDQIVEFAELPDFIDMPVKRYSSGMYVRLGFSVAAHMDPDVLLIDDVRPTVAQSWACVVPLRVGGGTRLKILEAMALGTPVVSTSKGAEGLEVTPGEDILIADEPTEFADAILRLLDDPARRAKLAANGQRLVRERYGWDQIGKKLDQLLHQVVRRYRQGAK
jgi:ABC-type polysaccharide/polyol phosphate transport system ATPase subunit